MLNYINDNADRAFHVEELQIWLFLVMLEHEWLFEGFKIGFSKTVISGVDARYEFTKAKILEGVSSYKDLIPIDAWMPKADGADKLCTTRYGVMHYMLQNHAPTEKRTRNFKYLHGNEFLSLKRGNHERGNTALDAFHKPQGDHR